VLAQQRLRLLRPCVRGRIAGMQCLQALLRVSPERMSLSASAVSRSSLLCTWLAS
jgi:hypothetical protein